MYCRAIFFNDISVLLIDYGCCPKSYEISLIHFIDQYVPNKPTVDYFEETELKYLLYIVQWTEEGASEG